MLQTITNKAGESRTIERRDGAPHVVRTGWTENDGRTRLSMVVHFGLHYIEGNSAPYFSIIVDRGRENGWESFCGACHEIIAEQLPELSDIIALHLSDIDGAPMYASANGWHWLAKAAGIPERWGPEQSPEECLTIFARHCRITEDEARDIVRQVLEVEPIRWAVKPHEVRRNVWRRICEQMRPRWKAEADAIIDKYGLQVYGARWPRQEG